MQPEGDAGQVRRRAAAENFVRQNGLADADEIACAYQFPALMFQPRVIAVVVLGGLIFQAWQPFLCLSTILWWNVLVPSLNPFDAFHNRVVAAPRELPPLPPATGPRRFAQAMAATSTLAVAVSLWIESRLAAMVSKV